MWSPSLCKPSDPGVMSRITPRSCGAYNAPYMSRISRPSHGHPSSPRTSGDRATYRKRAAFQSRRHLGHTAGSSPCRRGAHKVTGVTHRHTTTRACSRPCGTTKVTQEWGEQQCGLAIRHGEVAQMTPTTVCRLQTTVTVKHKGECSRTMQSNESIYLNYA